MNTRKQKNIILYFALLLVVALAGCSQGNDPESQPGVGEKLDVYELTLKEAEDINQNCNLGFEYMSFSEVPEDEARKWFGRDHPEMVHTDDDYVTGYYFRYPYDSEDRRLTQIYIEGGDYDFYGIKVGDDISKVKSILTEMGYIQEENPYDDTATEYYIKYHVYTCFETKEDSTDIVAILVSIYEPDEPEMIY